MKDTEYNGFNENTEKLLASKGQERNQRLNVFLLEITLFLVGALAVALYALFIPLADPALLYGAIPFGLLSLTGLVLAILHLVHKN